MAYEKNSAIVKEWVEKGFYGSDAEMMSRFPDCKTEDERIYLLTQVYLKGLEPFESIPLWEDGDVPGYDEAIPFQKKPNIIFFPGDGEGSEKPCVLVSPGGGYNCKASSAEGFPIIEKLIRKGYSAAMLDYRVKPYTQYCSTLDILRAVKVLRYKSGELGINPGKIAVHGGSAGGHLSCMAAVHYDLGDENSADPVERVSGRPDAAIISYGLFSQAAFPQSGAFVLMDKDIPVGEANPAGLVSPMSDSRELRRHKYFFSPEKHITPDTPPFFMWQTCDDDDPRFMFNFAKELADAGVRFEAHIFPYGPHGMGIADGSSHAGGRDEHVMRWLDLALEWMELIGF